MTVYTLQNRWKIEGNVLLYYGLRNREHLFQNRIRLTRAQRQILASLPRELSKKEQKRLGQLLGEAVVLAEHRRKTPRSFADARFCTSCIANDFLLPGLEFDSEGHCPLCQTAEEAQSLRSVLPLLDEIPRSKASRFDVALFYTGGKDSTYLLYHLAVRRGLRVLALTWEIPFLSETARASIENAKTHFPTVEFLSRTVAAVDLQKIYQKLYSLSENTCACPSLAYLLFYPELVASRVPYFLAGNEPVQMLGLYYNHMAPKLAYRVAEHRGLGFLINLGRLLTLHPPLKRGQLQTLLTMKQLAYGDHPLKKLSGYTNPLVSNVVTAIHEVPSLLPPLRRAIRSSSRTGAIPAFVHLDFDRLADGHYDWRETKRILVEECGWVSPGDDKKALHTSCAIERCKDHTQFVRFYYCRSQMIPFSALEIALASRYSHAPREELLYEMEHLLGCSLEEPAECARMRSVLEET